MSSSEQTQAQSSGAPTLCEAGCGFYANVGTGGLCSKCYRSQQAEQQKQQQTVQALAQSVVAPPAPAPAQPAAESVPEPVAPVPQPAEAAASSSPSVSASPAAPAPPKPSSTRCLTCNKKVGLTGFSCRCNPDAVFCSHHRYAEAHDCQFDYKGSAQQRLKEANPVVQASKLQKF